MILGLTAAAALLAQIIQPVAVVGTGIYSIYNFVNELLFQGDEQKPVQTGLQMGNMQQNQILNIVGETADNASKLFDVVDQIKTPQQQGSQLLIRTQNQSNFQNALRIGHHLVDVFSSVTQSLSYQPPSLEMQINRQPLNESNSSNFITIRSETDVKIPAFGSTKMMLSQLIPAVPNSVACFVGVKSHGIQSSYISMPKQQIVLKNHSSSGVHIQTNSFLGKVYFIQNEPITYNSPKSCVVLKKSHALMDEDDDEHTKTRFIEIDEQKWGYHQDQ